MKTNIVTKYVTLALFSASFIVLNNCGNSTDSSKTDPAYGAENNGNAADFYGLPGIPSVYPIPENFVPLIYFESDCNDGTDNDGDGLWDCMDNDCHIHPECSEFGPPLEEIVNSRAMTVYPNGIIVPEDIAIRNARPADDDDHHDFLSNGFFATHQKDCWIAPIYQDPYYHIPVGEALMAGPEGPIGPQLDPNLAVAYFGPRAGLINECELASELMFHHVDDDNGAGAGAAGDKDDDDGGIDDDSSDGSPAK